MRQVNAVGYDGQYCPAPMCTSKASSSELVVDINKYPNVPNGNGARLCMVGATMEEARMVSIAAAESAVGEVGAAGRVVEGVVALI